MALKAAYKKPITKRIIKTYFGGKGSSGSYQAIINNIRPHKVYIEPFLGAGSVFLAKRRDCVTYLNDADPKVINEFQSNLKENIHYYNMDIFSFLSFVPFYSGDIVMYLDPPYPHSTRKSSKRYNFELTDHQHIELLRIIRTYPFDVLISSYDNEIYNRSLSDWRRISWQSQTRGGTATEVLWCNFDPPEALHDYRYLGIDFRERERISRKLQRWRDRLLRLPALERAAIIQQLNIKEEQK
jgi:DNA adenine methylase